jgi:hypothetical protein
MYVFSEEIRHEIDSKTSNICSLVGRQDECLRRSHVTAYQPDQLINEFEDFHLVSRDDLDVVRYFIKRRQDKLLNKLAELQMNMPLKDHLDDKVWDYLQLMYLLYENAHSDPKAEIQVALLNRLEVGNTEMNSLVDCAQKKMLGSGEGMPDLSIMMSGLMGGSSGEGMPDLSKMMSGLMGGSSGEGMPDLSKMMSGLMGGSSGEGMPDLGKVFGDLDMSAPEKTMEKLANEMGIGKDVSANPEVITNILEDIKGNLMESGKNVNTLLENTKKLGEKYKDKIQSGELSMKEMMGSLMGVMKDPSSLVNMMKDIDLSNLPDPTEMMGSLMGGSVDINGIMSKVMGGQKPVDPNNNVPLTAEQLKELDEFYSSLNLK